MNPCELREPKVIDNALLIQCIKQQAPKGEAGRLVEEEGIPLEEVDQIRLEFLNLLKIDHLWVLTSLTKLSLNNNLLEKVENLDSLVNLIHLDLSFNKISKIENLDALVNLEKLSFFDNLIETLENMDMLVNMTIFSIGRNKLTDLDNVLYLRRFTKLISLNMVENPCSESDDFRQFVAVFLQQIVYYEYRLVRDSEREMGQLTFSGKLRALQESEQRDRASREALERMKAEAALHSSSFVEYLNTPYLFELMFVDDNDGKLMLEIGEEVQEFYDEYKDEYLSVCMQIFENGQKQYHVRKEEHEQFLKSVKDAKSDNQQESIKHMELFLGRKALIFYDVRHLLDELENNIITYEAYIQRCEVEFNKFDADLHVVWKSLMKLELQLYEQMEELNQNFEHSMTELVNNFIETSQGFFSQIRTFEVSYSENVSEAALRYQTNAHLNEDFVIPDVLKDVMADKDALHNSLATSHDMHMQIIDNREDTLVNRSRGWLEDVVDHLSQDEIKRNRAKVLEINHFLDIQREEFEDLHGEPNHGLDADMVAALE